ncbi:MAG: hypothetical protein KTR30_34170 [Saprospiraceae bacterium]|nr:hypothetical protein [Saprospiraceae bacterium]
MKAPHFTIKAFFWVMLFQLSYGNTLVATASALSRHNPELDLADAWESLQSLTGYWKAKGEQLVKWKPEDPRNLQKVLHTADEQRILGQLIREDDQIIYKLNAKGEQFILQLTKVGPTSWTFEAQTNQLLQTIELSLTENGVLKSEMIAVSPSGRRLSTYSEVSRIATADPAK